MKTSLLSLLVLVAAITWAQDTKPKPGFSTQKGVNIVYRGGLGKWWQDSEVARKLQLNDGQIAQLNQVFYEHRLKLIDDSAGMEKEDLKLQQMLDADVPNEGEIGAQIDRVLTARGRLEREYTMMNLDLRKVLSLDQWRELKSIRGTGGAFGDRVFIRKVLPPGAKPEVDVAPAEPPFPAPPPDDMF